MPRGSELRLKDNYIGDEFSILLHGKILPPTKHRCKLDFGKL